jgi:hypothetical protein
MLSVKVCQVTFGRLWEPALLEQVHVTIKIYPDNKRNAGNSLRFPVISAISLNKFKFTH